MAWLVSEIIATLIKYMFSKQVLINAVLVIPEVSRECQIVTLPSDNSFALIILYDDVFVGRFPWGILGTRGSTSDMLAQHDV